MSSLTGVLSTFVVGSAALLVHMKSLPAQIAARGIWLSAGLLAGIDVLVGWPVDKSRSVAILAALVFATIAMGRRGLSAKDAEGTVFQPNAHRGSLLAVLCISIANMVSLAFFGSIWLEAMHQVTVAVPLAAGLGLGAAGIYRMRSWGVLATAASSTALGGFALGMALPASPILYPFYVFSSLIQLALLFPLLKTAAQRVFAPEREASRVRIASAEQVPPTRVISDEFEAERELAAEEGARPRVSLRAPLH